MKLMKRVFLAMLAMAAVLTLVSVLPATGSERHEVVGLVEKVEATRGQSLTADQRRQLTAATLRLDQALQPPQQTFNHAIAQLFSLPEERVRDLLPPAGVGPDALITRLEVTLGRAVTPAELQRLRIADNARHAQNNEILS